MVDCFSNCSVDQTKKCKYAVCASTMILFLVLILLAVSMSSSSEEIRNKVPTFLDSDYDLKIVHVVSKLFCRENSTNFWRTDFSPWRQNAS